jgi:hypothetical protein
MHGECVVMRIIERASLVHDLDALGFGSSTRSRRIRRISFSTTSTSES